MGGAPLGEDPLEAARRELREETGLTATHWRELMRLHPSNSITDEIGIVYVATGLSEGDADPEETEDLDVRALPLSEAIEMARDGRITDALSAATLFRMALERSETPDQS
jgi:8-oxo-dGTP pyrophosphatase MutT (NUDIX family)